MKFSLFEGDALNELLRRLQVEDAHQPRLAVRVIASFAITWGMLLLLACIDGVALRPQPRESFALDIAAYSQFFLALPLLLSAEPYLARRTGKLAEYFLQARIVPESQIPHFERLLLKIRTARRSPLPDLLCVVGAYVGTWVWLGEELKNGISTWHALAGGTSERLTLPGWWAGLVASPLLVYLFLRWIWKVALWCWFLRGVASLDLAVFPPHPDRSGGLGFVGTIQSRFGVLLLAVSIVIAATVHHKLVTEHASLRNFGVWSPIALFVALGPPIFLAPLLFFTRNLAAAKRAAVVQYGALVSLYCASVQEKWLGSGVPDRIPLEIQAEFSGLAAARETYDAIQRMHIVPFDLGALLRLLASAAGPMLPIVVRILPLPESLRRVLDFAK